MASSGTQVVEDFKDTEVGSIPADWNVVRLADVVTFSRKPRKLDLDEYELIPFVPMEFVPDDGIFIHRYDPRSPEDISSGTYVERGDVLLAKITPSFENGKQGIIDAIPTPFAYATTEVYPLKPIPEKLNRMFLFHLLRSPSIRTDIAAKMEGSTGRQRIPKAVIQNYFIPLPPLKEQDNVAHVLNTIQRAIEVQSQVITAARELKRSLMHRLFTYGPDAEPATTKETEFGPVPEHWGIMPLKKCAFVQTGAAKGRKLGDSDTVTLPYLRVANVQDGYLDLSEIKQLRIRRSEIDRYSLQPGDVVLTEGGDFDKLGRGFIWRGQISKCIHQNHIFAVRTDRKVLLPRYLSYLVQSTYGKAYFLKVAHRTTHLASINSTKLKAFPTLVPDLNEQKHIADMLTVIDRKLKVERDRRTALQTLFKSMLHQLMTGQIRVRDLELKP
jgi:type I restriction enzyme S subunit